MAIKAIMFDMDGTLLSSGNTITQAYKKTVGEFNLQYGEKCNVELTMPEDSFILEQIGKPRYDIYKSLFPNLKKEHYSLLEKINSKNFNALLNNNSGELFPKALELLTKLKQDNYLILIASNGGLPYLTSIISNYSLPVDEPLLALDKESRFVKADILKDYLDFFGLDPQEAIMVGDRIMDLEAAEANKTHFIGIIHHNHQYGTFNEIEKTTYKTDSLDKVYSIIKEIEGKL